MRKCLFMLTAVVAIGMFSCKESPYIGEPGDSSKIDSTIQIFVPDTDGIVISVDSAITICNSLPSGESGTTVDKYKITGYVTTVTTSAADMLKYHNLNFKIASEPGGNNVLTCYKINNVNNLPFLSEKDMIVEGTKLTVLGPLMNYSGTPEVQTGFIVRIDEVPGANQ